MAKKTTKKVKKESPDEILRKVKLLASKKKSR